MKIGSTSLLCWWCIVCRMPKGKNTEIRRNFRSSVDKLPIVVGGSNPEIQQAMRAMEGEVTVLTQILDMIVY